MAQQTGTSGDDVLKGKLRQDDEIRGQAGDDTIYGYEGDDKLYGGEGHDTIAGGDGDDRIYGGAGDDSLWGDGTRSDVAIAGATDFDTFIFEPGNGNDTIRDFNLNEDRIDLSHFNSISQMSDLNIQQQGQHTLISLESQSGGTISLLGVNASDLDSGDFIFQGASDADAAG